MPIPPAARSEEGSMPGSKFSGLQKLVALSVITLIALIAVSQINTFSPGDADGTATGSAVNIGTYSGNGGSAFSDACQAPATEEDAAKCAKDEPGGLAALIGHEKIAINFTWLLIAGAALHAGGVRTPHHRTDAREERRAHDDAQL